MNKGLAQAGGSMKARQSILAVFSIALVAIALIIPIRTNQAKAKDYTITPVIMDGYKTTDRSRVALSGELGSHALNDSGELTVDFTLFGGSCGGGGILK